MNKENELDNFGEKPKNQLQILEELLKEALSGHSPRSKNSILHDALKIVNELQ